MERNGYINPGSWAAFGYTANPQYLTETAQTVNDRALAAAVRAAYYIMADAITRARSNGLRVQFTALPADSVLRVVLAEPGLFEPSIFRETSSRINY